MDEGPLPFGIEREKFLEFGSTHLVVANLD